MFIGTNGDGIFQHLGNEKFDRITFEDGLPSYNIISLAPSSDSLLSDSFLSDSFLSDLLLSDLLLIFFNNILPAPPSLLEL